MKSPKHVWNSRTPIAYISPSHEVTITYELDCACPSLRGNPVVDGHQIIHVEDRQVQIRRLLCPTCGKRMKLKMQERT